MPTNGPTPHKYAEPTIPFETILLGSVHFCALYEAQVISMITNKFEPCCYKGNVCKGDCTASPDYQCYTTLAQYEAEERERMKIAPGAIAYFTECYRIQGNLLDAVYLFEDSEFYGEWIAELAQTIVDLIDEELIPKDKEKEFITALETNDVPKLESLYHEFV